MKSIILIIAMFLSCTLSVYAQMTDQEYEAEVAKLKVLFENNHKMHKLHVSERRKLWEQLRGEENGANRPEKIKELRDKLSAEQDWYNQNEQKSRNLRQRSDSIDIKWARGVVSKEESDAFLKHLLEIKIDYGMDRQNYLYDYIRMTIKQDSIAGMSREESDRYLKAIQCYYHVYASKNLKLTTVRVINGVRMKNDN